MGPERRQNPRTTLGVLAYINFETNNGGIVLNASEGGLCFQSVAPVRVQGTMHFWFSAKGRRIDCDGELMWTDETHKTGGLQFNGLSAPALEYVRNYLIQAPEQVCIAKEFGHKNSPYEQNSSQLPFAQNTISALSTIPANSASEGRNAYMREVRLQDRRAAVKLTVFSRGVLTGILISAFVVSAFLLHSYRRELGEALIGWGERFGAVPPERTVAAAPAPLPELIPVPAPPAILEQQTAAPAPPPIQTFESDEPLSPSERQIPVHRHAELGRPKLARPETAHAKPGRPERGHTPRISPAPFAMPRLPFAAAAHSFNLAGDKLGIPVRSDFANQPEPARVSSRPVVEVEDRGEAPRIRWGLISRSARLKTGRGLTGPRMICASAGSIPSYPRINLFG